MVDGIIIKIQAAKTLQHAEDGLRLKCFCCFNSVFANKTCLKELELLGHFYECRLDLQLVRGQMHPTDYG